MPRPLAVLTLIGCGIVLFLMLQDAPVFSGRPPVTRAESRINSAIIVVLGITSGVAINSLRNQ